MSRPTRKAIARYTVTAVLIVVVAYPLSYAPVVRLNRERHRESETTYLPPDGFQLPMYRPVDWLIDSTPLGGPMFLWARLWRVEDDFRRCAEGRAMYEEMTRLREETMPSRR